MRQRGSSFLIEPERVQQMTLPFQHAPAAAQ